MIRTILKWTGIVLGAGLVILLIGYFIADHNVEQRRMRTYAFPTEELSLPTDSSSLRRGEHLATIKGCTECHGNNLAGKIMADGPDVGRLVATNLTRGKGGLPADYTPADWMRALRHGVDRAGRPLLLMPSHETTQLSAPDLSALIAYCTQLPAVTNELPPSTIGPVLTILAYFDQVPLLSVEKIDHTRPLVAAADTTEGAGLGKYLAVSCIGCHRPNLKGGEPMVPGQPAVPDLTRSGNVGRWTQTQFIATLRTGRTPRGHQMNNDDMPWTMTAQYSQKELASLYQYFQSIH